MSLNGDCRGRACARFINRKIVVVPRAASLLASGRWPKNKYCYATLNEHSGQTSAHVRALEWRKGGQNGGATSWVQVETLKSPHWS